MERDVLPPRAVRSRGGDVGGPQKLHKKCIFRCVIQESFFLLGKTENWKDLKGSALSAGVSSSTMGL